MAIVVASLVAQSGMADCCAFQANLSQVSKSVSFTAPTNQGQSAMTIGHRKAISLAIFAWPLGYPGFPAKTPRAPLCLCLALNPGVAGNRAEIFSAKRGQGDRHRQIKFPIAGIQARLG